MEKKIKKSSISSFIIIFFCFFPYLQPASYILGPTIASIFSLWLKITWIIAILLTLISRKISKGSLYFILFQFVILFSTLLNIDNGDIANAIYLFASNCAIVLLGEYFIKKKNNNMITYLKYIYAILMIINFISIYLYYPQGMYTDILGDHNYYFLEHDNGSLFYTLSILYLFIIDDLRRKEKIKITTILLVFISFITYLYISSTTAYLCIGLLLISLLFKKSKLVNSNIFYIIFFVLLFLLLSLNTNSILYIKLSQILNKDITLSGRTLIWSKAIEYIKSNFILGYGNEILDVRLYKFGISHIHNILLQILYNGGIIALLLYIAYFKNINKKINKYKSKNNNVVYYTKIIIYLFLIASIFDFYNTKFIINLVFVIACNIDYLFLKQEGEQNE